MDGSDSGGLPWFLYWEDCPRCKNLVVTLRRGGYSPEAIYPANIHVGEREPIKAHEDVPPEFAEDYEEAALILELSPKASAALSRRCLQNILREKAGVEPGSLASEIKQAIASTKLPADLNESVNLLREFGNLGAHPIKNVSTGEIVPVEPGEAEWCLQVVNSLFDNYFVRPAQQKRRQDEMREKLDSTKKQRS